MVITFAQLVNLIMIIPMIVLLTVSLMKMEHFLILMEMESGLPLMIYFTPKIILMMYGRQQMTSGMQVSKFLIMEMMAISGTLTMKAG